MAWKIQRGPTWYIGYRKDGKDRYESARTSEEPLAEARRKQKEIELGVTEGPLEAPEPATTLDTLIDLYLRQADIKERTRRANSYCWAKFKELTNAHTVEEATREGIVKDFKEAAKSLSNAYLGMILRDMRKLIKYGITKGIVKSNPFSGIEMPEQERVARFLSEKEIERISVNSQALLQRLIKVELMLGLRPSQLGRMDWNQINLKQMILTIPKQKRQRAREIPIFQELLDILGTPRSNGLVFAEFRDKTDEDTVWFINGMWVRALRRARIRGRIRFYDLRHTCASRLSDKLSPYELRDFFGWSSVALTDRYTHTKTENIRRKLQS